MHSRVNRAVSLQRKRCIQTSFPLQEQDIAEVPVPDPKHKPPSGSGLADDRIVQVRDSAWVRLWRRQGGIILSEACRWLLQRL
jgi:hypothetical protein